MFESWSVGEVESELVGMAGHLAAGTCRFLQLLAEFDARDGWAGPGLRSCAQWLNWRVGMDARTARDQLRVAHALSRLPATTADDQTITPRWGGERLERNIILRWLIPELRADTAA